MTRLKQLMVTLSSVVEKIENGEKSAFDWYKAHEGELLMILDLAEHLPVLSPYAATIISMMAKIDNIIAKLQGVK